MPHSPLDLFDWYSDGKFAPPAEHPNDLVAEWTDAGPVRTVTKREIVSGTYSRVYVKGDDNAGSVTVGLTNRAGTTPIPAAQNYFNAEELRAAARILNELADAL